MTQREAQILQWIRENPLISQQELADRAGITRSSVSVHISNLMKKGYIDGRGYIVRTSPYVVVVGGANMDIGGHPYAPLVAHDSNPGRVHLSLGGVGRNIAHNMSLLGLDVRLVTALGDDVYAQKITASCADLGIDLGASLRVPGEHTSTYLFLSDHRGEMELGVADMEIYHHLTPHLLSYREQLLRNARLVVVDTNIPAESLAWLAENCPSPLFVDPVSTAKAEKLRPILGKLHTLKPNRIEAELLSGISITDEKSLARCADALLSTGLCRVYISLGTQGIYAADQSDARLRIPAFSAELVNSTGCGDAFMAALAWSWLDGLGLEDSARAGLAASAIAMEAEATINPELNVNSLRARAAL